jgi:hypothetical protein
LYFESTRAVIGRSNLLENKFGKKELAHVPLEQFGRHCLKYFNRKGFKKYINSIPTLPL